MAEKKKLNFMTIRAVPVHIKTFHGLAMKGQYDAFRGRKVRFDVQENDRIQVPLLKDAEVVWLTYKEREVK